MDAVTYPDERVIQFINDRIVPVRIRSNTQLASDFNVQWTPNLVILGPDGKEHHRVIGWLSPDELIPSLALGIAKVQIADKRYDQAEATLNELLDHHPRSASAPEALYWSGVAHYEQTRDLKAMRAVYEKLRASYPSSEWMHRASVYEGV